MVGNGIDAPGLEATVADDVRRVRGGNAAPGRRVAGRQRTAAVVGGEAGPFGQLAHAARGVAARRRVAAGDAGARVALDAQMRGDFAHRRLRGPRAIRVTGAPSLGDSTRVELVAGLPLAAVRGVVAATGERLAGRGGIHALLPGLAGNPITRLVGPDAADVVDEQMLTAGVPDTEDELEGVEDVGGEVEVVRQLSPRLGVDRGVGRVAGVVVVEEGVSNLAGAPHLVRARVTAGGHRLLQGAEAPVRGRRVGQPDRVHAFEGIRRHLLHRIGGEIRLAPKPHGRKRIGPLLEAPVVDDAHLGMLARVRRLGSRVRRLRASVRRLGACVRSPGSRVRNLGA